MNHEFSLPRAIWWGDRYMGTVVPCGPELPKFTHNMDVDYWLSKEIGWLIVKPPQEMTDAEVSDWYQTVLASGFQEVESLEASRDLRDIWFFANVKPSWVPEDWKEECVLGGLR